ncbi:MAG: chemotaxis protein CheB [Chloroflexota bacterium]|nr:chemotaxis protein CheB [Chloroflexota bacterium]
MAGHDIIVVGASAGGVEALSTLVRDLPPDLPAAVFVVLHIPAQSTSMLPSILQRAGALPVVQATDGIAIRQGCIYVAPPDHHLLVDRGFVRLVRGPKENRHRPAVDPLFRTAARAYGPRVVGVVLTGALDDGTAGLQAVKTRGGVAIVQDPAEAFFPGMPQSAMENVEVDHCLPLSGIAPLLVRLAREPADEEGAYPVPEEMDFEARIAEMDPAALWGEKRPGVPSIFSCPECKGVLYEMHDGELLRFRCQVGHAYSPKSMLVEQSETLEAALWVALNTLEENANLVRRLAKQSRERNHGHVAVRFEEKVRDAEQRAAVIREVLSKGEPIAGSSMIDGNQPVAERSTG